MAGFVEMHHEGTGRTARVPSSAVRIHARNGWTSVEQAAASTFGHPADHHPTTEEPAPAGDPAQPQED